MKNKLEKKVVLKLHRETLRTLTDDEMRSVGGARAVPKDTHKEDLACGDSFDAGIGCDVIVK